MHPSIREFPSKHFYQGKLTDGSNIIPKNYVKTYHEDPRCVKFFKCIFPPEISTNLPNYKIYIVVILFKYKYLKNIYCLLFKYLKKYTVILFKYKYLKILQKIVAHVFFLQICAVCVF